MIKKTVAKSLYCMSGNPKIIERDDMGRICSVTSYGVTTGILIDDYFSYFNSNTNFCSHCHISNLLPPHEFFEKLPDNLHPKLKKRYLKEAQNIIKTKGNPAYFSCLFYEIEIQKFPDFDMDACPYYENRFVIGARNCFYFINSSGLIEEIRYTPTKIKILQTFGEGELPCGTENLHPFLIDLMYELEMERQNYEHLRSSFPKLG